MTEDVLISVEGRVGCECQPSLRSFAPNDTPGMSFSMTRQLIPFGPSAPVRTMVT